MKAKFLMTLAVLFMGTATMNATDLRTVIFKVAQMVCENCEKKVKENIRCEKGLKKLSTDLDAKTVTVTYDADKTSAEELKESFKKFNYEAEIVSDNSSTSSKSSKKSSKSSSTSTKDSKASTKDSKTTTDKACCTSDKDSKDSKSSQNSKDNKENKDNKKD